MSDTEHTVSGWVVTTSGTRPVAEVAAALTQAGFVVGNVLEAIGVVTGRCTPDQVAALRHVAGVTAIEADGGVNVGLPGAPDTW